MARYFVQTTITFTGEVEANSEAEAEEMAWNYDDLTYDGVDNIRVSELDEEEEE